MIIMIIIIYTLALTPTIVQKSWLPWSMLIDQLRVLESINGSSHACLNRSIHYHPRNVCRHIISSASNWNQTAEIILLAFADPPCLHLFLFLHIFDRPIHWSCVVRCHHVALSYDMMCVRAIDCFASTDTGTALWCLALTRNVGGFPFRQRVLVPWIRRRQS